MIRLVFCFHRITEQDQSYKKQNITTTKKKKPNHSLRKNITL